MAFLTYARWSSRIAMPLAMLSVLADLNELSYVYLKPPPGMPHPLLFRSSADAYTIYSVGQNQEDPADADDGVRAWVRH